MQDGDTSGKHGSAGCTVIRQPRVREQAGYLTRESSEDNFVRATSPLHPQFPIKDHDEVVQRLAFPAHYLSRLEANLLKMPRKPGELFLGQVREDLDPAQFVGQACGYGTRNILNQVTPH
ncbi:MAG: hypothetical protein ABSD44_13205 [Terracidiphilus sp.]